MTLISLTKHLSSSFVRGSHLGSGSPDVPDHHEADYTGQTWGVLQLFAQVLDADERFHCCHFKWCQPPPLFSQYNYMHSTCLWGLGISSLFHFTCNLQIWITDGNKSSCSTQGGNIIVIRLISRGKQEGHMLMLTFVNGLFHGHASEWICGTCIHALPSFNQHTVAWFIKPKL